MKAKHMPRTFWDKVVLCAVYLLNRCPTKSVRNKTPNGAWSGSKPSVGHLRIFGCIAYAHVPDQKRKKLDDKGESVSLPDMTKGARRTDSIIPWRRN